MSVMECVVTMLGFLVCFFGVEGRKVRKHTIIPSINSKIHSKGSPRYPCWYLLNAFGRPWAPWGMDAKNGWGIECLGGACRVCPLGRLRSVAVLFGRVFIRVCMHFVKSLNNVLVFF